MDAKTFIDNLKRDKARGKFAPHQLIFLLALLEIYKQERNEIIEVQEAFNRFQKIWEENQHLFESDNNNFGMPLKALLNQSLIEVSLFASINDYRNTTEILTKIDSIKIQEPLKTIFCKEGVRELFSQRINN